MYTIGNVLIGLPKILWRLLRKKREYRLLFNKEENGRWYLDFLHWPFYHDNLVMKSGADNMCEMLAEGDSHVEVSVISANKQEQYDDFIELEQTEHSLFGGSTYKVLCEKFVELYEQDTIWLSPVTLFVLGRDPKFLYVKIYEEPYMEAFSIPSYYWTNRQLMRAIMMQKDINFGTDHIEQYFRFFSPNDLKQLLTDDKELLDTNPCVNTAYVLELSKIMEVDKNRIHDYLEEFIIYAKANPNMTYTVQIDDNTLDNHTIFYYLGCIRPALFVKNIILPQLVLSRFSSIFPWEEVDACMDNKLPARRNHLPCPFCGKASEELLWIIFNSPVLHWKQLHGRLGPLSICPDCHQQIEFLCEGLS